MGKGKPRAVEKGVLRQNLGALSSSGVNIPSGPVYYPTEEDFKDPLEFICKIRPEAEPYGICRIVPPSSWKPPFVLDLNSFTFPTKSQAIHQLQARPASCDSKTFELEYNSFLEEHCGKKVRKRVVFEGEDLDLCKLFNAVKRYGGFDKVVKKKKWGEVFRILRPNVKASECAKHVLSQLYREHLYDYETYNNRLHKGKGKSCKKRYLGERKSENQRESCGSKKRRRNNAGEKVRVCEAEEEEDEGVGQICEQCKSGLHGDVMLLCDRCNKGWHIYCLSPPLKQVPPGNWYCFGCLNSNKDSFGFIPGKQLSLEAFRRVADRAKKKWFGSGPISRVQVEKKFWQIVEGSVGAVEVMYGSDVDTSVYGSGFPRTFDQRPESIEPTVWDEYCSSPWNLNNLPKLEGSMLRKVHHNIAGVMVPWLYVGMLFSAFCWHYEDHCFYSMNYLHWGEPKCWYSVPGSACNAFEKVMRKTLPDLFDAQPDLLFQLVTMLNPSVLQANGVPVYNVVQEPGNFVITFPRSFHGGFNFGLNCAEAVNFAPADWIPHGGFGAELYRLYRKPAILSHEELLYVVAKSICDGQISPFLKKELLRIYNKEKTWRERLWKSGIIRSSPMSPRKYPEFVGTEEDPTCRICQQYLFLSAVVCRCRPSAFVCLEHWDHICECKASRHRLLYRHTLAELTNLVLMTDKDGYGEGNSRPALIQNSCSSEMSALSKKVKGDHATFAQLAEQWLARCSSIIQDPFSRDIYCKALKEAEQFLWAGSEMDPVRDLQKRLSEAKKWAEGVRSCLRRIVNWSNDLKNDLEKIDLEMVDKLLTVSPAPCNEPGHLKLKDYADKARKLVEEIKSALSSCSEISELEAVWSRSCHFPIHVKESEEIKERVSSAKVWIESVRICTLERRPDAVEIDDLCKLKLQISELQVSLPEAENLVDLVTQAESCRARCVELLKGPMALKDVEIVVQEMDRFPVIIPELQLLRQYHADTVSLISRFKNIRDNVHERVDQDSVVDELRSILSEGASLKVQVEELPAVELELKKACCRAEALKACSNKVSLDFLQHIIVEATILQIEGEDLFVHIASIVNAANLWEESAARILASEAPMFQFEDIMRYSERIDAILPSLGVVMDAITTAKSWLKSSKPFLDYAHSAMRFSGSALKVGALKELAAQSELLKIYLEERRTLETIVKKLEEWEIEAGSLLRSMECLFDMNDIDLAVTEVLLCKMEGLLSSADAVIRDGLSLGFDFPEIPTLQNAQLKLQWCHKVLSLGSRCPSVQEVKTLMEFAERIPVTRAPGTLCSALIDGMGWVKRAVEVIHAPSTYRSCSLGDAEEIISECQRICISFPVMVCQLTNAIQNHRLWQEQVHQFFSKTTGERTCSQLLQLKDRAKDAAFNCLELEIVLSEIEKVEKWKSHFRDTVGCLFGDLCSFIEVIDKVKITLDRSLHIFDKSKGCQMQNLCMSCSNAFVDSASLACATCKDCYHLQCLQPALGNKKQLEVFLCRFCQFSNGDLISPTDEGQPQDEVMRLELNLLDELLYQAEDLCVWINERGPLQELLERARSCKAGLIQILDFVWAYIGEDLNIISEKLTTALKAVTVARVLDRDSNRRLELALASYSWRVRARNLCEGSYKPSIQQIRLLLKEGMAINMPSEDNFRRKLVELEYIGQKWVNVASKVVRDDGALGLDKVFKLIWEGENLPVCVKKELKRLRSRSKLYCICRKPYRRNNQRVWITCDHCDELYHIDCVKLNSVPKFYICPACKPPVGEWEFSAEKSSHHEINGLEEPKTPSPKHRLLKKAAKQAESSIEMKLSVAAGSQKRISSFQGIDQLWWRNRKPFRRSAKKRANLDCLSPFLRS
ncbi:lysine-specific demethylase 5B [Punica granatum]|uniref:Lysine-specific demethylase 5B n=1 Tax=Punica granatum TaxID=22663 RepID=A0A6P8CDW9_PUNGR|nr:lysine-specific demethylase 5B [Punica granatum]